MNQRWGPEPRFKSCFCNFIVCLSISGIKIALALLFTLEAIGPFYGTVYMAYTGFITLGRCPVKSVLPIWLGVFGAVMFTMQFVDKFLVDYCCLGVKGIAVVRTILSKMNRDFFFIWFTLGT